MALPIELFEQLKAFLCFDAEDAQNLVSLQPIAAKHGAGITDRFYELIGKTPATAPLVAGRVDQLKATHHAWLTSLVSGEYGEAYLESRWRIGMAHVRIGLDPYWVEGIMSFIRTEMTKAIGLEIADSVEATKKAASFVRACDLDLLVINLSYSEDRLDRLTGFTGMKRGLIENIIRLPPKKA